MRNKQNNASNHRRLQVVTLCISTSLVLILLGLVIFFVLMGRNLSSYVKENIVVTMTGYQCLMSCTRTDYSYGQLSELPTEIGQLTKLTSLDFRSNKLQSIPTEIGRLTKLTSLDFQFNQLQQD